MADNIEIAKFSFNVDEVLASAAELKNAIDETKASTKELKESQAVLKKFGKEGSIAYQENTKAIVENDASLKVLNKQYNEHVKVLSENTKATQDSAIQEELLTLALDQQVTTIKGAREQNKVLNKLRNETNVTTAEGQAQLALLNNKLDANNKLVKENADAYLKQKINIGNYTQSIKDAFAEMEKEKAALQDNTEELENLQKETKKGSDEWRFYNQQIQQNNQQINVLINNLGGVNEEMESSATITKLLSGDFKGLAESSKKAGGAGNLLISTMRGVAKSILGVIKASLAFIATPIGAVVAAIGLVLGALVNYLSSTQSGIDAVTAVTRPLAAIFESLIGVLQQVGKFLFEAFSNPKKTIDDLYQFVKKNVITTFQNLFDVMVGIATLDFEQAKKGFKGLSDQATGAIDGIVDAGKNIGEFFNEAIEKGKELDRLEKQLEQTRISNTTAVSALNEELKQTNLIAEDQTKSIPEREAAAARSIQVAKDINALKQTELDLEIEILKNKQSRNDTTNAEKLELAELLARRNEFNAQALEIETTQQNKLNAIRKQAIAEANAQAKKAQETATKREKTLLSIYEETSSFRAKTLSEELDVFETSAKKQTEIYKQELKARKITQEEFNLAILQLDNELKSKQAELAVQNAAEELRIYSETIDRKLEANQFLSDEVANQRQLDNDLFLEQQKAFEALRLEQGVINQNEFDAAIREAKEENRIANEAIDAEREATKLEEQKELRAIAFEEELARLEEERATKFELEQAQLDEQKRLDLEKLQEQKDKELISEELFKAKQAQIDAKYNKLELQRSQILANQKLDAVSGAISAVSSVIDESSSAGKSLGIAQALINTYQGIAAGVKLGFPAAIPAVAAATTTGFQAVKKIASQKLPSASGRGSVGGGGGAPQGTTQGLGADLSSLTGQNVNLNSVAASGNSAVQGQIENQTALNGLSDNVASAVEAGALAGTMQGAEEGMTNLSDNRQIQESSTF